MVLSRRGILVGTFVKKNKVLSFMEHVRNKFRVSYHKIFVYEVENNKYEYFVTFRVNRKLEFDDKLRQSTVIHVKNGCLFSINALNQIIKERNQKLDFNYKIDWEDYRGLLVVLSNDELKYSKIEKIEDKTKLFN